jgi:hypothetical protein
MRYATRLLRLLGTVGALGLCALLPGACVEAFDGSHIELLLAGGVNPPGCNRIENGQCIVEDGRAPASTHFEFYVVRDSFVLHLTNFDVRPLLNLKDPCFIEDDESFLPKGRKSIAGLHATRAAEKMEAEYKADDQTLDDVEAGDVQLAKVRMANQNLLASKVKVVVAHDDVKGDLASFLAETGQTLPDITDITDEASTKRRAVCREFFARHPLAYVGTDKVFMLAINGKVLGMVDGKDPRNSAFLGGAAIDVDAVFPEFDALWINWQFNDREAACKAGSTDQNADACTRLGPSPVGYHFMAGVPKELARGVINVHLGNSNPAFRTINGEVAIFTGLGNDDVHF